MEQIKKNWKSYVMLQALILLYSLSSVCSKYASGQEFLSLKFILFYPPAGFVRNFLAADFEKNSAGVGLRE